MLEYWSACFYADVKHLTLPLCMRSAIEIKLTGRELHVNAVQKLLQHNPQLLCYLSTVNLIICTGVSALSHMSVMQEAESATTILYV